MRSNTERPSAILPLSLAPPPPFPLVTNVTVTSEFVAPGVTRADYALSTSAGPLAVTLVAVDLREPTIRLDAVLAHDRLVSAAETVSAMASRTNAVAGINGDYFDINGTNQPLGIVVRDGTLVRTPSRRAAMTVTKMRDVRFGPYAFSGTAGAPNGTPVPLTGVNVWPPEGGASLVGPAYGMLSAAPGISLAALAPLDAAPAVPGAASLGARYRVTSVGPARAEVPAATMLAYGPAALRIAPLPQPGDEIDVRAGTDPPLADVATAIGGGPLLVRGGAPFGDPDPPAPEETAIRYPVAGAALRPDRTLLLVAVDGREPDRSIGLTRPEFGALMQGFGASDGMAFDSGGSATLVARVLGEGRASVRNTPSDGVERPVADGLFVYSDAPAGPPSRLVVRPEHVRALAGAAVGLRGVLADAAGHPAGPASGPWSAAVSPPGLARVSADGVLRVGTAAGSGIATVARANLRAPISVDVLARAARIAIEPARAGVAPGGAIALRALAFDEHGRPVIAPANAVAWTTSGGTIAADGTLHAANADARVTARIGAAQATQIVRVGSHVVPLAAFNDASRWTFATVPANGGGALTADASCGCLALGYDFRTLERAAYARRTFALPVGAERIVVDVDGDASGVGLRARLVDGDATRHALTLARRVDWTGRRTLSVAIPADAPPPLTLTSIYAVATLGTGTVRANGTLLLRDGRVIAAGSSSR